MTFGSCSGHSLDTVTLVSCHHLLLPTAPSLVLSSLRRFSGLSACSYPCGVLEHSRHRISCSTYTVSRVLLCATNLRMCRGVGVQRWQVGDVLCLRHFR
jgi:hypothetical protein